MKKKLLALAISSTLLLSACGGDETTSVSNDTLVWGAVFCHQHLKVS